LAPKPREGRQCSFHSQSLLPAFPGLSVHIPALPVPLQKLAFVLTTAFRYTPKMQTFDMIMLAVLVVSTIHGIWRGMVLQVASLADIVLSFFAALRFSEPLAPLFGSQGPLNRFAAMFMIYLVTSLVVWLVFRAVREFIDRLRLQEFDRQIGGVLGAAKGVLWCVAITFFAVSLLPGSRDQILGSQSGHYIALLLNRADRIMPPEVHQVLDPYLNKLETELAPADGNPAPATQPPAAPALRAGGRADLRWLIPEPARLPQAQGKPPRVCGDGKRVVGFPWASRTVIACHREPRIPRGNRDFYRT